MAFLRLAAMMWMAGALVGAPALAAGAAPKKGPAPAPSAQADAALEAAIRAKFAKSKVSEDKFEVRVQGGVATIEGRTGVPQRKGAATRMAKTAGARAVNNRVQVSQEGRQKAAAALAKGRRRAQIKRGEERSERK